jgi:ankyrin repeat protein
MTDFGTRHFDKLDDKNFDVNTRDKTGRTLLFVACRICDETRVRQLITLGGDANIADNFGHTCLTVVCAVSTPTPTKLQIIRYLLEDMKMDPFHVTEKGETYMHIACKGGYLDIVTYLNTTYPTIKDMSNLENQSCLITAVCANKLNVVQYLLEEIGMDPNEINEENDMTCLMIACLNKQYDIVKQLVKAGAEINECNYKNKNALYYASHHMKNNYNTILLLLGRGAIVNERTLKLLEMSSNADIQKYLKENELMF